MPYDKERQRAYNLKTARNHGFATWAEYCADRRAHRDPDRPKVTRQRYATEAEREAGKRRSLERMAKRKGFTSYAHYNRERAKLSHRGLAARLRAEMLAAYGSSCTCCGESNPWFLTLEHSRVAPVRKKNGRRASPLRQYKRAKELGWPPSFTVFCMNCNWAARHSGICPHKAVGTENTVSPNTGAK